MNQNKRDCILYVPVGIPASGKSTWYKKHLGIPIEYISRDFIRYEILDNYKTEDYFSHENEVFEMFCRQIATAFKHGIDVYADATNINYKSRSKLINGIKRITNIPFKIIFINFYTPFEICLTRNSERIGRAKVPTDSMQSMQKHLEFAAIGERNNIIAVWDIHEFNF